ncbi:MULTISPECIES: DNA topoisomerase IV subunit A [Glutamicibacter]|uniref:DNA gyrase/topoisomerase IV subunit A n=1 Tax=Glutamicibacter TaxID=1742989 RepID=UPI001558D962|nr:MULTISPECIES: DNA topoisomerase IV subunit A [Glutamicibacter]MBF6672401.1 DNA topoisomerase IV subunit A [Glutamicibacter sp. FBE19]NQD40290.1 DNA topoisomerase IV subunit A [Glutamicibacter halophytocola]
MARKKSEEIPEDFVENIVDIDVTNEMESSFLEYAYSVIYSRALPDARDGLKPVQRRILFQMSQMGLRPEKGHVKSARVVGEVMGKLHPHGDAAIYDAMVRLAQDFSLRLPLIDGHGNFGSLDDGPAAPRYTEARLAASAVAMTANLDEDVVNFIPNYDNQFMQPEVLPAAFPNLLVNGTTGIAVGMATNMAPHNLGEVIAAARHLLIEPEATVEELMKFIPGPDLPSGGSIIGLDGVKDAYRTGRGLFRTRATVELEKVSARKSALVVTELPYGVGPEKVIEKIKDGVNNKKIVGISDVVDLTDRHHGLKLVIELKNGFNANAVLASLFKYTPMEDSFGINNVALVNGQPRTMGLRELLTVYVDHRLDVVRRRTVYRLAKREDRLHLVEGLLIAIVDIDDVIAIIRSSEQTNEARQRLMTVFDLSEPQANHILELRLRQLTKYSKLELETEAEQLREEIEKLRAILESDQLLRSVVSEELEAMAETFGTPRRTKLLKSAQLAPLKGTALPEAVGSGKQVKLTMEISDSACWALLSATGQIARTHDRAQLDFASARIKHDVLISQVASSARGEIGALTSTGRIMRISLIDVPVLPESHGFPQLAQGVPVAEFLKLPKNETVIALVPLNEVLAIGTRQGVVKRVTPEYPLNRDEFEAITLKDDDAVVAAAVAGEDDELVFLTRGAQLLRFPASAVRPQGRTGRGMAGIKLSADDHVIFFGVVPSSAQNAVVATIAAGSQTLPGTSGQSVKLTEFAEFPAKGRATAGVRAHRFIKGEDHLQLAFAGQGPARASSSAGVVRALPTEFGKRDGSGAPLAQTVNILGGSLSAAESSAAQAPDSPADAPVGNAVQDEHPKAAPAFNPGEDTLPFDDGGVIL